MRRRSFLGLSATAIAASALGTGRAAAAEAAPLPGLPRFAGRIRWTSRHLAAAAEDWGRQVHRLPAAVLRPASVGDLVRAVAYARQHRVPLAMRGQGHCVAGQAQAPAGIVIDSSPLNAVTWHGTRSLDAQAGALWRDVARTALASTRAVPVLPDALVLSVGGILSVGGTGDTSYRAGALVDHVTEMDVVTGRGELVTGSPTRERELFEMVLAGLGQCAFIVRARLRLTDAPRFLVLHALAYADVDAFLGDQVRLAPALDKGRLEGHATPRPGGGWDFTLWVGSEARGAGEGEARPAWMAGLRHARASRSQVPYWDHIDRRTRGITASRLAARPHPSLAMVLPEGATAPFLSELLASPSDCAGAWRIEVFPMLAERFAQPLHRLPSAASCFTVRIQREGSAKGAPDHEAMLAANRRLVGRMRAVGGKVYPPFAPVQSREEWREHYGPELWARLTAARERYDPDGVLSPGPGLFGQRSES